MADDDKYPELDEQMVDRIQTMPDEDADQRARALRAGLSDYDLDEGDIDVLEGGEWDPNALT